MAPQFDLQVYLVREMRTARSRHGVSDSYGYTLHNLYFATTHV